MHQLQLDGLRLVEELMEVGTTRQSTSSNSLLHDDKQTPSENAKNQEMTR